MKLQIECNFLSMISVIQVISNHYQYTVRENRKILYLRISYSVLK